MKFSKPHLDPTARPLPRRPAWPLLLGGALLCFALAASARHLWLAYPANAGGDAHTYAGYARLLARGRTSIDHAVTRALPPRPEGAVPVSGPVWNTALLADGRWVYTVAPGYPLLLAAMARMGGNALLLHANFLIQPLAATAFGLLLLLSVADRKRAWWSALLGVLLLLSLDTATQSQFAGLWREPFVFLLLLSAACAFTWSDRKPALYWVLPPLLGMACAVKESNVLYAAWMGVCLLLSPAFRRAPGFGRRVLVGGALFSIGCAPLLWQNWSHTGMPWASLYVARETGAYSLTRSGMGLSTGNTLNTLARYARLYLPHARWLVPLLAAACWGAWTRRRMPTMRLMVGWLVLHTALYIQWGNAEFRHMYFAVFPVVFAFVLGADDLLERLARITRAPRGARGAVCLAAIAALALWMPRRQTRVVDFRYSDWSRVTHDFAAHVPRNALVLANRRFRDVLTAYTDLSTIRLHELDTLDDGEGPRMVRRLLESGVEVFFVDCADTSPDGLRAGVDRARVDEKRLLNWFDLDPVRGFAKTRREFVATVGKPDMTLYRVTPWSARNYVRTFSLPADGASFVTLNPQSLGERLVVELDGRPVPHASAPGVFFPVPPDARGPLTVRAFDAQGQTVPGLRDTALVDWFTPIVLPCGVDAIPDDAPWFPESPEGGRPPNRRAFTGRAAIRVPVREGTELFTTVGLRLAGPPLEDVPCEVIFDTGERAARRLAGDTFWVTVPSHGERPRKSRHRAFTLEFSPAVTVVVTRVVSRVARTEAALPPADGIAGYVVAGLMTPTSDDGAWVCRLDGREVSRGEASPNPFANAFLLFAAGGGELPRLLRWEGGGLMDMTVFPVRDVFALKPGDAYLKHAADGFHALERGPDGRMFRWTAPEGVLRLPADATPRRLRLWLAGDGVAASTTVRLRANGHMVALDVGRDVRPYDWTPPAMRPANGLIEAHIEAEAWRPADRGLRDGRVLGVRWFGLEWAPVDGDGEDAE